MFLLDSMERGTPQRKTVYRISLTLVKREAVEDHDARRAEDSKTGTFRREASVEVRRSVPLEEVKEVEDESEECRGRRNFRTFSTGQLELGRLRSARKLLLRPELKEEKKVRPSGAGGGEGDGGEQLDGMVGNGGVCQKKMLLKAKSVEERSTEKTFPTSLPESPLLKRAPGLLRRSFSFRHCSGGGGELLRLKALAKDKRHNSSSCIRQDPEVAAARSPSQREKSRTLEVGAVLNKTDSMSELSRWERAGGAKNRTLDNSDLLRLAAEREAGSGSSLLRGGGGRSSERRLVRFFSGIFNRRDGITAVTPTGSPNGGRLLRRGRRTPSSTESMNGGGAEGKGTVTSQVLVGYLGLVTKTGSGVCEGPRPLWRLKTSVTVLR
ncbi:uncharacterized protein KZ484_019182 [Pholidichthys leucotaenia]